MLDEFYMTAECGAGDAFEMYMNNGRLEARDAQFLAFCYKGQNEMTARYRLEELRRLNRIDYLRTFGVPDDTISVRPNFPGANIDMVHGPHILQTVFDIAAEHANGLQYIDRVDLKSPTIANGVVTLTYNKSRIDSQNATVTGSGKDNDGKEVYFAVMKPESDEDPLILDERPIPALVMPDSCIVDHEHGFLMLDAWIPDNNEVKLAVTVETLILGIQRLITVKKSEEVKAQVIATGLLPIWKPLFRRLEGLNLEHIAGNAVYRFGIQIAKERKSGNKGTMYFLNCTIKEPEGKIVSDGKGVAAFLETGEFYPTR